MQKMNRTEKVKIIKLIVLIAIVSILLVATVYMIPIIKQLNTSDGQAQFKEKIQQSGIIGPLILFGLEIAQVLLAILPGEPIEVLAGICFGPIWGSIFLMISVFVITCIIYFLVKKYGRKFIYEFFPKEKVNKLEESKLFKDKKKIEMVMIILFLIPGTPKDLLVYLGGLLPIKSSRFILMSTLLRFPSIISSTIAGDNILGGELKIGILAYVITFLITFVVIYIVNKLDKYKVTEDIIESMKNKEMS